jgi:hypothetical protein
MLAGACSYHASVAQRPGPPAASSGQSHEESWDDIAFQVPRSLRVQDAGAELMHYRYGSFVSGPFVATVQTGPMCRAVSGGWHCARGDGIVSKPADGVVAWFAAAPSGEGGAADPGYEQVKSVCAPGAGVFHAYRALRGPSGGQALTLDGCLYGKRTAEYSRMLQDVIASARLTS